MEGLEASGIEIIHHEEPEAAVAPPAEEAPASPSEPVDPNAETTPETPPDTEPAASPETPPVEPETPPEPAAQEDPIVTPEGENLTYDQLKELSGGKIVTPEDLKTHFKDYQAVLDASKEKSELEFPDERSKWLYNFAQKFPGMEASMARNVLNLHDLDLKTAPEKEVLWQAELMSEKSDNVLTESERRKIFENDYAKRYGKLDDDDADLDESELEIISLHKKREVANARESLATIQGDFNAAAEKETAPVDNSAIENGVKGALGALNGKIKMSLLDEEAGEDANFEFTFDQNEVFEKDLISPEEYLNRTLENNLVDGKFEYSSYVGAQVKAMNVDKLLKAVAQEYYERGKQFTVKAIKNPSTPEIPETPGAQPKSENEKMKDTVRYPYKDAT